MEGWGDYVLREKDVEVAFLFGFQQRSEGEASAQKWGLTWPLFAALRAVSEAVGWRLGRLRRFMLVVLMFVV
jgi:hypothetical protein